MQQPCLTQLDAVRLERLLQTKRIPGRAADAECERLDELLAAAHIVPGEEIPADVVTMNSRCVYRDLDNGAAREVTLVYPEQADHATDRIAVTSGVGAALLGMRACSEVAVELPGGHARHLRIEAIPFQPEAAGEFHL